TVDRALRHRELAGELGQLEWSARREQVEDVERRVDAGRRRARLARLDALRGGGHEEATLLLIGSSVETAIHMANARLDPQPPPCHKGPPSGTPIHLRTAVRTDVQT